MKGRLHFGPGTSAKPWKTAAVSTRPAACGGTGFPPVKISDK
jgi:hypothetical protein